MRPLRHLRRLRARWRLHCMEWNNYYRPMEPPKGYEKYYTLEEVFPGLKQSAPLRDLLKKTKEERAEIYKLTLRIYRHSWTPDPDVHRELQDLNLISRDTEFKWKDGVSKAEEVLEKREEQAQHLRKGVATSVETLQKEFKAAEPQLRELGKNRLEVLRDALRNFSDGYAAASSGQYRAPWEETEMDHAVFKPDNRPLRYEVFSEKNSAQNDMKTD